MRFQKLFAILLTFLCLGGIAGAISLALVIKHYSRGLPDYMQLTHYNPSTITRLYAANGKMIAEYAEEKRLYVPIEAIPKRLINAFIAAEDKNFYSHPGIDISSIIRAAFANALHYKRTKSLAGGSTITQQVVKNFLLTKEKSFERKIREAILAFRITKAFSKDRIMELYLNQIYLGNRSFGVAAAAQNYFNKSIGELSIEEAALLAAMPKAPSSLDPKRFPDHALERRNWVISRMEEENYITQVESVLAMSKPITLTDMPKLELVNAGFFTDAVKQQLIDIYGEEAVMKNGLAVRTTLDPDQQKYAEDALMNGIRAYDHRHGWRGPIKHLSLNDPERTKYFKDMPIPKELGIWSLALVTELSSTQATLLLKDGTKGIIPVENMSWARQYISRNTVGRAISNPSDVLKVGDVIAVSLDSTTKPASQMPLYMLEQIPQINGAIVALDPHTGRVHAMVGGYYYGDSQFNRVTQAKRQPGSSFKPFVYLTALENNFRPNSIIVDEPIYLNQGPNQKIWSPQNHTHEYYGPTTLRNAVEQSRNVVTVRLSQMLGIDRVSDTAKRFNINSNPPRNLSMVLGSAETTLLNLTTAYGMIVNGGKKISPSLIERVQNRNGQTIYKRDQRTCSDCFFALDSNNKEGGNIDTPPSLIDNRTQVADPIASYQIVSFLEGVVQRGTARRALALNRTIGGKTGTTNESFDTWFIGFTPDLVVGVFAGFDEPSSLGHHEYGSSIALPIWINFMANALQNKPDVPFRRPNGVKLVKINLNNGLLPSKGTSSKDIIFEAFRTGTEPKIGDGINNRSITPAKGEPDLGGIY